MPEIEANRVMQRGAQQARAGLALAAGVYTAVSGLQRVSGFLILIVFTRLLSTSQYGQVALLVTAAGLLTMLLTFGLEPVIVHGYFREHTRGRAHLRGARRASLLGPLAVGALLVAVVDVLPIQDRAMWMMVFAGAALLAAGTTYPYALLRAERRSATYAWLALTILVVQVGGRVLVVGLLEKGPRGWAFVDLLTGVFAFVLGVFVGRERTRREPDETELSARNALWKGLPLIPHYLSQWGLALGDRVILALYVTTATVGVYSALYQVAAVSGLVLMEFNRAVMPQYAEASQRPEVVARTVRLHLRVTFAVFLLISACAFVAIYFVFPGAYTREIACFPLLAVGALLYVLYGIPMNGLTLVAGVNRPAAIISGSAFVLNIGLNVLLDYFFGLWGAVIATAAGYLALLSLAVMFERRYNAIRWGLVFRDFLRPTVVGVAGVVTLLGFGLPGVARWISVGATIILAFALIPTALLSTLTTRVSRSRRGAASSAIGGTRSEQA